MTSGVLHAIAVAALFLVRPSSAIVVPGPDVVQVALLDPSMAALLPAPAPAPQPEEREEPTIAPIDETGVKIEPKKKEEEKKKPPEEKQPDKRPEPEPARPREPDGPAPALPYEAVGSAGLRGQLAVDAADFEFTYYLLMVRNRIAQSWTPPAGGSPGGAPVRAVVYFRIHRGGQLSSIRIESPSGVEFFDRTAVRAVTISDPLPPLPLGYTGSTLGVHFGFEYSAP